jgi:hypothetical protein
MKKVPLVSFEAEVQTDDPQKFEILVKYRTEAGIRYLLLPRSGKRSIRTIRRTLDDCGAILPDKSGEADRLITDAFAQAPSSKLRVTERCGWLADSVFVLPHKTFGMAKIPFMHRNRILNFGNGSGPEGNLDDWKAGVHQLCLASNYATFAIGLALVGPLLTFLNQRTGLAFNFGGESGAGKTTVLQLAQSVVGKADYDSPPRLDITPTALEELAYECNDGFLPLDEFGTAELSLEDRKRLRTAVSYKLRDGIGRRRSKSGAAIVGQSDLRWRVVVLTSSEYPLSEMGKRRPGEEARFIDIVVPSRQAGGVLDRLSELDDALSGDAIFGSATIAIASNYGVARDALVEKIIGDVPRYAKKAKRRCDKFVSMVSVPTFRPVQARYKEAFGKVYAALLLAVDLKLVPFDRKHAKRAVLAIYRRSELQLVQSPAGHESLKKLAGVLNDEDQCPRWAKGEPLPTADIWALRCDNVGQPEFYIEPKKFEHFFGRAEAKAIEAHLLANGVQLRDPTGKARRQPPGKPFASAANKRPRVIVLDAGKFTAMIAGFP